MKPFTILHISDIHYREKGKMFSAGDVKDSSISKDLQKELDYDSCREELIRRAPYLSGESHVDVLACTGDLGWEGKRKYLLQGLDFLNKLSSRLNLRPSNVIIAPGNHDLRRKSRASYALDELERECAKRGFACATGKKPYCKLYGGVPIICFNSCIGATEHALYGSRKFWGKIKKAVMSLTPEPGMSAEINDQLTALDIPAIGKSQIKAAADYLDKQNAKCCIALMHHNPLPTPSLEVRPYGTLVDSGAIIFRLIENSRKVLLLHGHTHWDSVSAIYPPDVQDTPGFLAAIGCPGMGGLTSSRASIVKVLVSRSKEFLAAVITRFEQSGTVWQKKDEFTIWDVNANPQKTVSVDRLPKGVPLKLEEAARKMDMRFNDKFAEELLSLRMQRLFDIQNLNLETSQWRIVRRV